MKKILLTVSTLALFACGSDASDITLYYMPGCPHCHNAINFLDSEIINNVKIESRAVTVEKIDVTKGGKNAARFNEQLKKCSLTSRGVPVIVVKGECIQGFGPETGEQIKVKLGK